MASLGFLGAEASIGLPLRRSVNISYSGDMAKKKKRSSKLAGPPVSKEARLFAGRHGLSLKVAEAVIAAHGFSRTTLDEEVEALKIELQFDL